MPRSKLDQPMRVFLGVVDAVQHHIFKGDPFRIRQVRIVAQRVQQVAMFQRLLIGTSTSRTASVVAWKLTASWQPISVAVRAISGTTPLVDRVIRRRPSAMPSPSITIASRRGRCRKLYKRLAHPHQHDVRDQPHLFLRRTRDRPFVQIVARQHDLTDDFGRRQVAHQFLRAGVAEGTGQRAADLEEMHSVPRSVSGI
jgi:hypothetical protein